MIEENEELNDLRTTLGLKEGKVIPLMNDRVFKFSMQQNNVRNYLAGIINHITKIRKSHLYKKMYFRNNEFPVHVSEKGKVTDLFLETGKYSIDVEMNKDLREEHLIKNNLYMFGAVSLDLNSGEDYQKLNKHIQISFNNKNLKNFMDDKLISRYVVQSDEHSVIDKYVTIYQIDLSKAKEIYENDFDNLNENDQRFIKFLLIMQKDDIVELRKIAGIDKEMNNLVDNIVKASKNKDILLYEYKQQLNEWADNAIREKEREKERKEDEQKGLKKGLREGEQKGILKTAKNMLNKNLEIDFISELTGLSVKEIEALK